MRLAIFGGCIQFATKEFSKTAANNKENNNTTTTINSTHQQISPHITNSNSKANHKRLINSRIRVLKSDKISIPNIHIEKFTFILYIMTLTVLIQQISAGPILPSNNRPTADNVPVLPITGVDGENVSNEINARIHKRHLDYMNEMNSQEMEWVNPCGGSWDETLPHQRIPVKRVLGKLRNDTIIERKTLNLSTTKINISDIRDWSIHKPIYKFLPVLKLNSNVALRRWHRQMQLFVGSFAYLRRAQLQWDYAKTQHENEISKELLTLKQSALKILCEIENAINNTSTNGSGGVNNAQKRHHKPRLNFLTRDTMEKRLDFRTNLKHLYATHNDEVLPHKRHHHQQQQPELSEVNPIDLKFAKYRYFNYLRSMVGVLRRHIKRRGRITLDSKSASSASASASVQESSLADSLMNSSSSLNLNNASNSVEMLGQSSRNRSRNTSSSGTRRNNGSRRNGTRKPKQQRRQKKST